MPTSSASTSRLGLRIEQARWGFQLPDGARRLIAEGDLDGDANESLVRWLASDRVLAERLLRWCNTPLYNLAKPYESLAAASQVIETSELARLAVVAFVRGQFLPDVQIDTYRRESLWQHSIAVAAVAAMISRTCGCSDPSLVFVAGALHDIGLCASERLDPELFAQIVWQTDELSPTHEVEQEMLGWDHAQLGAAIMNHWGMPDEVQRVARHHHDAQAAIDGPHGGSIGCVAIANYLCSRAGRTSIGCHHLRPPGERVFAQLGIDAPLLTVLWQQLPAAFDSVRDLR